MGDGIDADDFTLDAVDQTVREHSKREPAQIAGQEETQTRKLKQELDRAVYISKKPLRSLLGSFIEVSSRLGELFVGLRHEAHAHG